MAIRNEKHYRKHGAPNEKTRLEDIRNKWRERKRRKSSRRSSGRRR